MNCPQPYEQYEYDEELSFKNFVNQDFKEDTEKFNGKVIYETCFLNEQPDSEIFDRLRGATFIKCNLDNLIIPEGNTVIDCSQKRFKAQNDLNDWLIDEEDKPIKPIDYERYEKMGLEVPKPQDIPDKVEMIDLFEKAKEEKKIREEVEKLEADKLVELEADVINI